MAIAVGRPTSKGKRRALRIRGYGETNPFFSTFRRMREEIITMVDLAGLTPVSTVSDRKVPKKDRRVETTFGKPVQQQIKRPGRRYQRRRIISGTVFDGITALFTVRSLSLRPGSRRPIRMRILAGTSLYLLELRVKGKERLYTELGPRDTVRVEGFGRRINDQGKVIKSKAPRRLVMWLSSDRRRVPLRMLGDTRFGPVVAHLSSYRPPRAGLRVRTHRLD